MSLCVVLQTKNSIIISGDSRACITVNGIDYANGDDAQKLYHIDNMVIFSGGSQWVSEETIKKFNQSNDKSIETLNKLGKETVEDFEKMYPDAAKCFYRKFEVIVTTFEGNSSVVYSLSSFERYRIKRLQSEDTENMYIIGYGRDEAFQLCKTLRNRMSVITMYQTIYKILSNERVGGMLTIYELTKNNIKKAYMGEIIDNKPIREYKNDRLYNRFSIGPQEGFVAKRSDNTVKAVLNATEGISIQFSDDYGLTWEAVFYVSIVDGKPKLYLGGDAVFTGDVTGANITGSTMIGNMIKTAEEGPRIEITAAGIKSYNISDLLHGLQCDPSNIYPEITLYRNGSEVFGAKTMNDGSLSLDGNGHTILYSDGYTVETIQDFDFSLSTVTGLEGSGYAIESDIKEWVIANFVAK